MIEAERRDAMIESPKEVMTKASAMPVVIFPKSVGVPMEPKTAWLPAPPNAEPISAPLPD